MASIPAFVTWHTSCSCSNDGLPVGFGVSDLLSVYRLHPPDLVLLGVADVEDVVSRRYGHVVVERALRGLKLEDGEHRVGLGIDLPYQVEVADVK